MLSNLRQNPFTKAFAWQPVTREIHTISEFTHLPGLNGVLLKELPRPESLTITFTQESIEAVIVDTDPLASQARVDYQRGHILFNPADRGKEVSINYEGGGTNLNLSALKEIIREVIQENA